MQGEGNHQNKKTKQSDEQNQSDNSEQSKGSNQAANPLEEDTKINKNKNRNSPVCPLHGPAQNMNLCKVMMAQAKSVKLTWLAARGGGAGRVRFQVAKNQPA